MPARPGVAGGGLLSLVDAGGSTRHYPTFDGNGNMSEYVNQAGTKVAHFEFDPFGNPTVDSESNAADFPYRFSTKPQDPVTGLYYYGYRYYDPLTGRWPSRDPIDEGGGPNLYNFVVNDGIDWADDLGLRKCCCGPDITEALKATLNDVEDNFNKLSWLDTQSVCWTFITRRDGWVIRPDWDIDPLNAQFDAASRIVLPTNLANLCGHADSDNSDSCKATVTVDGECHYSGTVNYALFGKVSKLCNQWQPFMVERIRVWKIGGNLFSKHPRPWPHRTYENARAWANAGYFGWLTPSEYWRDMKASLKPVPAEGAIRNPEPSTPLQMNPRGDRKGCTPCNRSIGKKVLQWKAGVKWNGDQFDGGL